MKNLTISNFQKLLLLGIFIFSINNLSAQVEFKSLDDFGTAISDINSHGQGVLGGGYYDFATNTPSFPEDEVGATNAITDSGIVLGQISSGDDYVPAIRVGGVWTALPSDAFVPGGDEMLYDISENGKYIVGQTGWTPANSSWGFIYNTETEVFTELSGAAYNAGAAYGVNNNGYAVGWVEDPETNFRKAAYFDENGGIYEINQGYGEASQINNNNEIVGFINDLPFIYKVDSDNYTNYFIPSGYDGGGFSDISDTGVIIGYIEEFNPMDGNMRSPIMMHESFDDIKLFSDLFADWNITSTIDGTAYRISQDGKYISGWTSGPAMFAMGWAIYLDDVFDSEEEIEYCIPEYDDGCEDGDTINNVTLAGESITLNNDSGCSANAYGDYTDLAAPDLLPGETYTLSVSTDSYFPDAMDIRAWIDYNANGIFEDSEEIATTDLEGMDYSGTETFSFTVPENAAEGNYRMRVRMVWWPDFEIDPCDYEWYGETEDYTVHILYSDQVVICDAPENIVTNNITDSSVEVSWDSEENGNWEIIYGPAGFDVETEGESILTEETFALIEDLDAETSYDIYVRTICDNDNSDWEGPVNFTTAEAEVELECLSPIDVEVSEITDTQAEVNWTAQGEETSWMVIYGETGFTEDDEYFTETVSSTTITLTDLAPETSYDIYVMAICDEEDFMSDPSETVSFITDEDMGVNSQFFEEFTYYPNPMEDVLNLKASVQIESIQVFNLLGQILMTVEPHSLITQINTEALPAGVYMMNVQLNGSQKAFRLIKK